jgi:long-chain acyl-CoA synthetase
LRIEDLLINKKIAPSSFRCIDEQGDWDYKSLVKRVYNLRDALLNNGVKHLDRVVVLTENGSSFIVGILATMLSGGIAVPVDPQIPYNSVLDIIRRVEAKNICISGTRPETNFLKQSEDDKDKSFTILSEENGDWNHCIDKVVNLGVPKGIVQTHKSILANVDAVIDYMKPKADDIFYIAKTMVHASTITGELLVALKAGLKLVSLNPVVSPKILLRRIEKFKPSIVCVNPTILRLLLKTNPKGIDLSSIRLLYTSGAVADVELLSQVKGMFESVKILNVYGLTEAGPRLTAQLEDDDEKFGSVGKAIKEVDIFIYNDENELCKPGEIGQVYVETQSLMKEYWRDNKGTEEKIVNNKLKTGDLGYFDECKNLFIIGRADDMIIRGGHNIDPHSVENIILKFKGITNCIVFGIADKLNGNKLICTYIKESGVEIEKKNILAHCSTYLASYECPQELREWNELPTTPSGKLSRRLAVEKYNRLYVQKV